MLAMKSLRKMFKSKSKIILSFCVFAFINIIVQKNKPLVKNFAKKITQLLMRLEKLRILRYNSKEILHNPGCLMKGKTAFFIDIDGTLTAPGCWVHENNAVWLKKAQKDGHKVFINTGRSKGNIDAGLMEAISFADGIICGNGSHFIMDGKDIFKRAIPVEVLCRFSEYVMQHEDLWCLFEGEEELISINCGSDADESSDMKRITHKDDFKTKYSACPIEVIAVGRELPEEFAEHFADELTMFKLDGYWDCVLKGCNKAEAMLRVLDIIGFEQKYSVAVGDSENDRSMLEAAGISVAMGNADEAIKEIADMVTLPNTQGGVGEAVRRILYSSKNSSEK